jgi:hypothetical protein
MNILENKLAKNPVWFRKGLLIMEYQRVSKETYFIVKVSRYHDRGTSADSVADSIESDYRQPTQRSNQDSYRTARSALWHTFLLRIMTHWHS